MKVALFPAIGIYFLVSVTSHPVKQSSLEQHNNPKDNDQDIINQNASPTDLFNDTDKDQVTTGNRKRHSFYKFWRTISKNVLPLLGFLEKATLSMLEKYCTLYRLSSRSPTGDGCLNMANMLSIHNGQDFPQSPSVNVMALEGTHHFEKSMYTNMINSLRTYGAIFKEMLKYEKERYHKIYNKDSTRIDCSTSPKDEVSFFICQIDSIIISNIHKLTHDMKLQGRQYFSLHLPELKIHNLPHMPPEPARRYFNLVAAYKFLEQIKETEWSLEYILMLEKDKAMRNRRSRLSLFYEHAM